MRRIPIQSGLILVEVCETLTRVVLPRPKNKERRDTLGVASWQFCSLLIERIRISFFFIGIAKNLGKKFLYVIIWIVMFSSLDNFFLEIFLHIPNKILYVYNRDREYDRRFFNLNVTSRGSSINILDR